MFGKVLRTLLVAVLVLVAALVFALGVRAEGPTPDVLPPSAVLSNAQLHGQGGDGPTQAEHSVERQGPQGQGSMTSERNGPPELVTICSDTLGTIERPSMAAQRMVEQGHAVYGPCPGPGVVNPLRPILTGGEVETQGMVYTLYLPFISKGVQSEAPVVQHSGSTFVRITTIRIKTITITTTTTTTTTTKIVKTTTVSQVPQDEGNTADWLIVLTVMATPILLAAWWKVDFHAAGAAVRRSIYAVWAGSIVPWYRMRIRNPLVRSWHVGPHCNMPAEWGFHSGIRGALFMWALTRRVRYLKATRLDD